MKTFGELKASRVSDVVGVCSTGDTFRHLTNEAVSRLMTRGSFWSTVAKLSVCVRCSSIVWPRAVDTVLAVNLCGRQTINSSYWWQFMPMNGADYRCAQTRCGNCTVVHDGQVPVQRQLTCGNPRYVRAYPSVREDVGKVVTLFGVDANGQEITTKRADGLWLPGVQLTLALPFFGTPFLVREVSRVLKDATQGVLRLYAYDPVADVLEDLAFYAPSERSPSYLHSRITGCRSGQQCNGLTSVSALVRMRFIPVETDEDVVQIDNEAALKYAMLSIRAEDSGDSAEASRLWLLSIHELNTELRSKLPLDEVPVVVSVFGSATPRACGVGMII